VRFSTSPQDLLTKSLIACDFGEFALAKTARTFPRLKRFFGKLHGGSQPILIKASNHVFYVVKFLENLQGPNLLFNEALGIELYSSLGLAVPRWEPLLVTDEFLDRYPGCWVRAGHSWLRPEAGLCFGSRYVARPTEACYSILPGPFHSRVRNRRLFWLALWIDICCGHSDRREAVFVESNIDRRLDAYFVDFGYTFRGPLGETDAHFRCCLYPDERIYPNLTQEESGEILDRVQTVNFDKLWKRLSAIPLEWQTTSAISAFQRALHNLANRSLGQSAFCCLPEIIRNLKTKNMPQAYETIHPWVLRAGVSSKKDVFRQI
jgi:hypothetical protein